MASAIVRFISDLHLSHKNLILNLRGFNNIEEHDEFLIKTWNNTVKSPKDLTYILGDVGMERSTSYPLLEKLRGRKIVVLGNHERHQDIPILLKYVESVGGMIEYKGFVLTHCPIHPITLERFRGNIHGHVHRLSLNEPKYYNVSVEVLNYRPISLEELINVRT